MAAIGSPADYINTVWSLKGDPSGLLYVKSVGTFGSEGEIIVDMRLVIVPSEEDINKVARCLGKTDPDAMKNTFNQPLYLNTADLCNTFTPVPQLKYVPAKQQESK